LKREIMKTQDELEVKPGKKFATALAIIVVLVSVGSGLWPLPDFWTTDSGTPEPIVIRTTIQELAGLIYIAEDQSFFAQNGLNVTIHYCDTGLACVEGMADGEAEIAASAEYPVVGVVLKHGNISVIGSIDKYQGQYVAGRKDRGIEQVADLRKKKIGVARGTSTEFYLSRFLYLNSISLQDVTFVNVPPSQFADSIENGSVDAIIVPQVYLKPVEVRLGSNAVIWQAQSNQNAFGVLTCRNDWIASHPETINKLLKSLEQAENYALSHPTESKALLQKRLNYTDEYMAAVWPQNQYSLTLDMSLVTAMEDEGRWMIKNNLTSAEKIPDFRNYIYTKGLEEVKPEAVNIR
jgi:NitT/TauT family transport system substrate-binding protein